LTCRFLEQAHPCSSPVVRDLTVSLVLSSDVADFRDEFFKLRRADSLCLSKGDLRMGF